MNRYRYTLLFTSTLLTCGLTGVARAKGANGLTDRISLRHDGTQAVSPSQESSLSADGRRIAFTSLDQLLPIDTNLSWDVYVLDRDSGVLTLASSTLGGFVGNNDSTQPSISADGNWVAFASDRVSGQDGNGACT